MFSSDVLRWELDRSGLLSRFSFVMSSSDYGIQKPHSALFRTALTKIGLSADEVWFVGDNFEKDVVGSSNVGMTAIWYKRHVGESKIEQQAIEVNSWQEFMALLSNASAASAGRS